MKSSYAQATFPKREKAVEIIPKNSTASLIYHFYCENTWNTTAKKKCSLIHSIFFVNRFVVWDKNCATTEHSRWRRRRHWQSVHAPTTTILDLCEDVLSEVFKKLDTPDLMAIGRVCSRFREFAKGGCYRLSDIHTVTGRHPVVWLYVPSSSLHLHRNRNIIHSLQTFGSHSISLEIDVKSVTSPIREQLILETILNCCPELDSLKLTGFHFTDDMVPRLRSILPKILHLKM